MLIGGSRPWLGFARRSSGGAAAAVVTTPSYGARPVSANAEYLSITDAAQTGLDRGTTDFSVGIWPRLDSVGVIHGLMSKKATHVGTDPGWALVYSGTNRRYVSFCDGSAAPIVLTGTANEISVDTQYLIIATFDRDGNMTSAINGGARNSVAISAQPGDIGNAADFQLFKWANQTNYLDGGAVCAFVYNGLLSEADEDTLYNAGTPLLYSALPAGLQAGMVSYFNLDEQSDGSGAVTRNDSKGTNHLTDNNTTPSSAFPFTG